MTAEKGLDKGRRLGRGLEALLARAPNAATPSAGAAPADPATPAAPGDTAPSTSQPEYRHA